MMLSTANDQAYALIITAEGGLEIELGPEFCDTDIEPAIAAAEAVAEALRRRFLSN